MWPPGVAKYDDDAGAKGLNLVSSHNIELWMLLAKT